MKAIWITIFCLGVAITTINAQLEIEWARCYGGSGLEQIFDVHQKTAGRYIVAGYSNSNNNDVSGNHGATDVWVSCLDLQGGIQWQKCLGGTSGDWAYSIQQTTDMGYILAGTTNSNNGDVSGNHGVSDVWVAKTDSLGFIQWQKCLGGTDSDGAKSIHQTTDGGYIFAGHTWSYDGDVSGNHGAPDILVVKLDSLGIILWQKCLGGTSYDFAESIQQTTDGGYIVTGQTMSNNGDVSGNNGMYDMWVAKLDSFGSIQWQKCLGGTDNESAKSIKQTTEGGYIVAGSAISNDGDVSGNNGLMDMWVVKLDPQGNIQWQKCLGGTDSDNASSIQMTTDGGYVLSGRADSNDGDVSGNKGLRDMWVVKIDPQGNIQWQKCLGGTENEEANSIQQTTDGGYIVAGYTYSNDGDVSGNNGSLDMWVVKLNETTEIILLNKIMSEFNCFPNPVDGAVSITLPKFTRKVEVYNINGELVQQLVPQKQVVEIHVKDLPKGVYVVKLYSDRGVVTTKFVKE